MNEIEMTFDVTGTVHQRIIITNGMTPEQVKEGFKNGTILTSIGHNWSNGKVYSIENGNLNEVGYVASQEALDDTEISVV